MRDTMAHHDASPELQDAIAKTQQLVDQMKDGSLQPVFLALDYLLPQYEKETGETVESLIHTEGAPAYGFSLADLRKGESFAKKVLCDSKQDIRIALEAGIAGGAVILVPFIAMTLFGALNPVVYPIAAAIAAVVLIRGVKGFCEG